MPNDITNSQQLEEIKRLICDSNTELANKIENLYLELTASVKILNNKIGELQSENKHLKDRVELLERKGRRNNIIIFGLAIAENTNVVNFVAQSLSDLLKIQVTRGEINNAYLVGQKALNVRPVIVEFVNFTKKTEIFKNCNKLKGSAVSISNDLTIKEREVTRVLVRNLKEARGKKLSAKIKNNLLYIGDDIFTYEQLLNKSNTLEDEVFIETSSTRLSLSAPSTPLRQTNQLEKENLQSTKTEEVKFTPVSPSKKIPNSGTLKSSDTVSTLVKTKPSLSQPRPRSGTPTNKGTLVDHGPTVRVTRNKSQTTK